MSRLLPGYSLTLASTCFRPVSLIQISTLRRADAEAADYAAFHWMQKHFLSLRFVPFLTISREHDNVTSGGGDRC